MTRWVVALVVVTGLGALVAWWLPWIKGRYAAPIRVGLLHSKSGSMAANELPMIEGEIMAIEQLNAREGRLLGRRVEFVVADGQSDPDIFAREARRLIVDEKVSAIFGCYASFIHRAVRPVVEEQKSLLFFPVTYEGLEQSKYIVYTGAAPNQQIIPTLKWAYDHLRSRKFYMVGTDCIYSHGLNAIIGDLIKSLGGEVLGEEYVLFDSTDFSGIVRRIQKAKPDLVINSLLGQSNVPFCKQLRSTGLSSKACPVISYTLTENELREFTANDIEGDYITASYLEAIATTENLKFIRELKARYGEDKVASDTNVTAYNSVYLWAQAVDEAESDQPEVVRDFLGHQSLAAPEGIISIDAATQHAWRPSYIARIRSDKSTETVWTSMTPIRPVPYPPTRSRAEWESFVEKLQQGWGGRWLNTSKKRP
jgi:urea transport system substrate-binding protein